MLAFYMDHQVWGRITHGLRDRGIKVLTAFEDGRSQSDDSSLLDRAGQLNRIFVSQDHDLLRIGRQRQRDGSHFYGIVFLRQEPMDVNKAIEYLELVSHLMSEAEFQNHIEYVPTP